MNHFTFHHKDIFGLKSVSVQFVRYDKRVWLTECKDLTKAKHKPSWFLSSEINIGCDTKLQCLIRLTFVQNYELLFFSIAHFMFMVSYSFISKTRFLILKCINMKRAFALERSYENQALVLKHVLKAFQVVNNAVKMTKFEGVCKTPTVCIRDLDSR